MLSMSMCAGEGVGEDTLCCHNGLHPRRSNSMGSLSEPDCYMNSLWPRLSGQVSPELAYMSPVGTHILHMYATLHVDNGVGKKINVDLLWCHVQGG